ncbi:hypothetical protein P7K49_023008, partial [Saguinus oedipus]
MLAVWMALMDDCLLYGAVSDQDAKFVEERRKQLQNYLRSVMNKVIQMVPEFASSPKKETLIQLMPFFVSGSTAVLHDALIARGPKRTPGAVSGAEMEARPQALEFLKR